MDKCPLCQDNFTDDKETVILGEKGSRGVNKASSARCDSVYVQAGQTVHTKCRSNYCNPNYIASSKKPEKLNSHNLSRTRSQEPTFSFKTNCLFCGRSAKYSRKRKIVDVFPVRTKEFGDKIRSTCLTREDSWSEKIFSRLEFAQDLHAVDAIYHQTCSVNFRTNKDIPRQFSHENDTPKKLKLGRQHDLKKKDAFLKTAEYLEQVDDEQVSVQDLIMKMQEFQGDTDAYGFTYMKQQLLEYFGDRVFITEINGKPNVITLRTTASKILQEHYQKPRSEDPEKEKMRLLQTASKLIKNDIKSMNVQTNTYPTPDELSNILGNEEYLPSSLKLLLQTLFVGKDINLKLASIGQAIAQAVRPRLLRAPLQIGLAIQLHHHFASKYLIDTLSSLGFCSSYSEVKKFEYSSAVNQGIDLPNITSGRFVQFVADNVDHNVRTLDGRNTFHGMGIIATITPGTKHQQPIPRTEVAADDLAAIGKIRINFYKQPFEMRSELKYTQLPEFAAYDPTSSVDLLWKTVWLLRPSRPAWSGMMQAVHKGSYPGQASVVFLPMIDMDPTDLTCIYSTLLFVCDQARKYDITPVLTFDQPLWWKAMMIIHREPYTSDLQGIVLRLGGLHTEMSFLGCIGHLMSGSGLFELLDVIYATNAVTYILSGKAIARAVRAHLLVETSVNALLLAKVFQVSPNKSEQRLEGQVQAVMREPVEGVTEEPVEGVTEEPVEGVTEEPVEGVTEEPVEGMTEEPVEGVTEEPVEGVTEEPVEGVTEEPVEGVTEEPVEGVTEEHPDCSPDNEDLTEVCTLFDDLIRGTISTDDISSSEALSRVVDRLQTMKDAMKNLRTAKLWMQYMEMVDILRSFIRGERTGNWNLHLKSLSHMLPYFAASGHNLYAKSVHIYLQMMAQLPEMHPEVHKMFEDGHHVVRRSDRFWGGLSSDLVIEQVLMRSLKTNGGLTRGTGMNETQRLVWLMSMPARTEINNAMQELTQVENRSSEQHTDMTRARIHRNTSDVRKLVDYLTDRDPFHEDPVLRNIANGITANNSVNADEAKSVGSMILNSMSGKNVSDFSFKKSNQAVTLNCKPSVEDEEIAESVDPRLLFQRLVTAAGDTSGNLKELMKYELCTYPTSLFDSTVLLKQANKSLLSNAIWEMLDVRNTVAIPKEVRYVLDGGSLLQRLPWPRGITYNDVCGMYCNYVTSHYGMPTIVFDGYNENPATKDMTHLRRTGGVVGATVMFEGDMIIQSKKEQFLTNAKNKQRFLNLLSDKMKETGCTTVHAEEDADVLIAKTAVEQAQTSPIVVIGEDTDLIVLLCYHAREESHDIFFHSSPKSNSRKPMKIWDINATRRKLGHSVTQHLLFIHAILGCDTTSRIHSIGKAVSLKKFQSSPDFREYAKMFDKPEQDITREQIIISGEKALLCLYNSLPGEDLNDLRYRRFCEKVASSMTYVTPQSLPPTSAAAKFHSMRVYHQVQQWKAVDEVAAEEWGWKVIDGRMIPQLTDIPAAPKELLTIIKCNCKTSMCGSNQCSCRRHGLQCSSLCGECRGMSCLNCQQPEAFEDSEL